MPRLTLLAVLATTVGQFARADEKEARAILERAIKAHGGESALARAQTCERSSTGTLIRPDKSLPFTQDTVQSLPDRVRLRITLDRKLTIVLVLNGKRGWQRTDGPAVELLPARLREVREEAYLWWLTTLVPLTRPGFTLDTLPEAKLPAADGEPAVGIKVSSKGHPDVKLYFLKRSGLLARAEHRVPEGGLDVDKEYLFSAYKTFDGVKLPTREVVNVNGKKSLESTVSKYRFLSKAEAGKFGRP
jgi:hypothetical protein